ncbi:MAG: DUF2723 domain-containing protein [bacterium]|jgi:hypothetical protein
MSKLRDWAGRLGWQIAAVYLVAQALYLVTLAPTVLWGDDARFQRRAVTLDLVRDHAWDHPFWVVLAHPFTWIPLGDPAFRVNLFTSIWAALAIGFVFGSLKTVTRSIWASAAGAGSLMVAHTFWTHAVRTEVYSLNMLLLSVGVFCLLRPRLKAGHLAIAALAAAMAIANHVMMILVLPGLAVLAIWRMRREGIRPAALIPAVVVFLAATGAYRFVVHYESLISTNPADYMPSAGAFLRAVVMFAVYLVLQFPSPGLLLAARGIRESFARPPLAAGLLLILLANVAAVLKFTMRDTYVFYMLAYFTCAFFVGLGWKQSVLWLVHRTSLPARAIRIALLASLIAVPVAVYSILPGLLGRAGIDGAALNIREIEGRPVLKYFLFPPKNNHFGARRFAEAALDRLPPDAVIIADHTLRQPILYLQEVEGRRLDVDAVELYVKDQVAFALSHSAERRLFLAETRPYYDIEGLSQHFEIVEDGTIYRLDPIVPR